MEYYSSRIQIIAITVSVLFLLYISRLIIKEKLREEYAIFWVFSTMILIIFSFWREGLDVVSGLMGVSSPPNIVFTIAIFAILIYLLHLSVVVSQLHNKTRKMAQEMALLKTEKENDKKEEND